MPEYARRKTERVQVFVIPQDAKAGDRLAVGESGRTEVVPSAAYTVFYEPEIAVSVPASLPSVTTTIPRGDWIVTQTTPTPFKIETPTGHWDGDEWEEPSGRRVEKKWVLKYPAYFGPAAVDPDHGCGNEEISKEQILEAVKCIPGASIFVEKFWTAGGTFSTWAEIHSFIVSSSIGYTDVEHSADVPPCPEFWLGESQYWVSGIAMGRASKKVEEAAAKIDWSTLRANLGAVIGALVTVSAGGAVAWPEILQILQKLTGVA